MSSMTPDEFDALTRVDFQVFVERVFAELNPADDYSDNFHISIICQKLEAMRRGELKRLIINVPPRSLKSIIASVAFPAFVMGHDPTRKVMAASYGQDLSDKHARDCRQVMLSDWYQRVFPRARLAADRRAVHEFETTMGGSRVSTSIGGAVTGLGAHIIIVDDPTKPEEALSDLEREKANQWYNHTLTQRLNDKANGSILVVMQRLHPNDFVGHIKEYEEWEEVSFPAIAQQDEVHHIVTPHGPYTHHRAAGEALHPDRESLAQLAHQRKVQGTVYFATKVNPLRKIRDFDCEFAFRDRGKLIYAYSRPGVFSHRHIDPGARALMNIMEVKPGMKILDLGCGAGTVSLAAAFAAENVALHAVDSNARAIQSLERGIAKNEAPGVTYALDADGASPASDEFDLALANPPYFSNYAIADLFLDTAHRALKPKSKVLIVTKTPNWFVERMPLWYADVEVGEVNGYWIVTGRKRKEQFTDQPRGRRSQEREKYE